MVLVLVMPVLSLSLVCCNVVVGVVVVVYADVRGVYDVGCVDGVIVCHGGVVVGGVVVGVDGGIGVAIGRGIVVGVWGRHVVSVIGIDGAGSGIGVYGCCVSCVIAMLVFQVLLMLILALLCEVLALVVVVLDDGVCIMNIGYGGTGVLNEYGVAGVLVLVLVFHGVVVGVCVDGGIAVGGGGIERVYGVCSCVVDVVGVDCVCVRVGWST